MGDPCCQCQDVNYVTRQIKILAPLVKKLPLKIRGVGVKPSLFSAEEFWLVTKGHGFWFGPRSRSRPSLSKKAALGSYEGEVCVLCPVAWVFPPLPRTCQPGLDIHTSSCEDSHAMSPAPESLPGWSLSCACHLLLSFVLTNSDLLWVSSCPLVSVLAF